MMADFSEWLAKDKAKGERSAVIYDQYGKMSFNVSGTRDDIKGYYDFYRDAYPGISLGIVCPEYYQLLARNWK